MKKDGITPDPAAVFPLRVGESVTNVRPTVTNPNITVGDFTYFSDADFEKHVTHLYEWNGDKLVIGKFCQIAAGVEFVMNGANHQMNALTTFPFYIMKGWEMPPPEPSDLPLKGDTVVGNDVWIGQNVTVLPGVHIGDGAIIGLNSTVASDIPPYAVAVGDPARVIRYRFDEETVAFLEKLRWWDRSVEEINEMIPYLTSSDPGAWEKLKEYL